MCQLRLLFFLLLLSFQGCDLGEVSPPCQYEIQELGSYDSIHVFSTEEIGASLYNLTIQQVDAGPGRKKRGGPPTTDEFDILMDTNSSYYELVYAEDHHEVRVKACLLDGHAEDLDFFFNETLDDEGSCGESTLKIVVKPANPNFSIPVEVNVSVTACVPGSTVEVLQLQFLNGGSCSAWNCSVNTTDDGKLFWIDEGNAIQTSLDDINFTFAYELLISCFDDDAPELIHGSQEVDTTGDESVIVRFIEPGSCTSTSATVTTSVSDVSSYFDDPANVALVSSVGGITVGVLTGAGISIIVSQYCKTKQLDH